MKQKYCILLVILMAFTQPIFAGGGGQPKRPGSLAGTFAALSYLVSHSTGLTGGNGYEDDEDDGDDTDIIIEDEENQGNLIPLYLIGENRDNETDLAFQALMIRLALEGEIVLVHGNRTFLVRDSIPTIIPEPANVTFDVSLLPLIQSCCIARNLLSRQDSDDALLGTLAEIVIAIMDPNTPELSDAIDRLHDNEALQSNHIYKWIINNSAGILKHKSEKRTEVIKKTWRKAIQGKKPKTVKNLKQLLEALLLSLLETDSSILNILDSPLDFESLDTWNDLIIARYLQGLYASQAEVPVMFLGDITVIRRAIIQQLLETHGITPLLGIQALPIDELIKTKKQNRIDEGDFETPVAIISLSKKFPVYLIGEVHDNQIDTLFKGAALISEKAGLLILGRESRFHDKPGTTLGSKIHGLEDQLASTLGGVQHLMQLLLGIEGIEVEEIIDSAGTTLASIASASDPLLLQAIETAYNDESLKDNWVLGWIKRNTKKLLKKDDFEDRMTAIQKTFKKTIEAKNPEKIKNFIDGLRAIKMAILEVQKELSDEKQLTETQLDYLRHDTRLNQTKMVAAWRDIFIAENIQQLYLESEEQGIPLVVILGALHIDNMRDKLEGQSIEVSSDVMDLPLVGPRGETGSKAKAYIQKIKEAKQARLDKEIPEHSKWLQKEIKRASNNENVTEKLDKLESIMEEIEMMDMIEMIEMMDLLGRFDDDN